MIVEQSNSIINEVSRALLGKREVIEKALMAIYAGGHILLEDVPGTGKTTLALALSRALGLDFKRVQFTPDTLPSDITGFTMFDRDAGVFRFVWGAVNCNMLLGDEINPYQRKDAVGPARGYGRTRGDDRWADASGSASLRVYRNREPGGLGGHSAAAR